MSGKKKDDTDKPLPNKRVFINNVDTYQGSSFARYLSRCLIGASLEPVEDEEEIDDEDEDREPVIPTEGVYEIIGTIKDKTSKVDVTVVKEVINSDGKEHLYECIVNCDYIIYDITDDVSQVCMNNFNY